MSFTYVKIPADSTEPIEELTGSKAGGLEHDELIQSAKSYFQQQGGTSSPSCEIMALSIPLPKNDYKAVSLYSSDTGKDTRENSRATQLVTACGHSLQEPVKGDVFVGRAYDNEAMEWERSDFSSADTDPTAEWCRLVRSAGGGGGQGGSASSLSSLVQKQLGAAAGAAGGGGGMPQILGGAGQDDIGLYGMNGAPPVQESWGTWTQSDDEVELKLVVPPSVKGKDCQITFRRNQIKVGVNKETKVEGSLFGAIVSDECTFTLESMGDGRELCITLAKADEGVTWSWLTAAK